MIKFERYLLIFITFFLSLSCFSQNIDHWESLVLETSTSKYLPGNSAPETNWQTIGFDDSDWIDGTCSVGYGDNDDLTEIESVLSVYLRTEFEISDLTQIKSLVLNMDYDDAFVAYLNGVEVARSNIGTVGAEPAFDQVAASNHEALLYQNTAPEIFNLSTIYSSVLINGKNVLAVQVHSVANSSDLTCMPFLSIGVSYDQMKYFPTPDWFEPPYVEEKFESSNLPILIIETEGGANIVDEPKVNATLKIAYNEEGKRNYVAGPYHESSGLIGIEIRGNVTQTFPKKPYIFETRDSLGENRNVEILGLPKENDWILRACYLDKTLMRNAIACQMSRNMGRYASRFRYCEVILNGRYDGVYTLMEQIKLDKNRVDLDRLTPEMTDSDSITGGYIYQVSQKAADFGNRRSLSYPAADEINEEQLNYIKEYDDKFRAVMNSSDYADPLNGYSKYIDVQSFIDEIIVQEATKNSDAYGWSSYFFKDRKRKLSAGPIWDFDQALANSSWNDGSNTEEWNITKVYNSVPPFWAKLFNEPKFQYLFKTRWLELRKSVLHTDSLMNFIDSQAILLEEAQQRNFERWPILGEFTWRSLDGYAERDTYQKEVDYMKDFLQDHLNWMDDQMRLIPDQEFEIPELVISELMYSAMDGDENEYLKITNPNESKAVNLEGIFFSNGIKYGFEEGAMLQPKSSFVLASNMENYEANYKEIADGKFFGQLQNSGERIRLVNSYGLEIDEVVYTDSLPWPEVTLNTNGPIALKDIHGHNGNPENWEFKTLTNKLPQLVISEIMYNPLEGNGYEWIEIVNASDEQISLAGIYFSEGIDFAFTDTQTIDAGEYLVLASNKVWVGGKYEIPVAGEFTGKLDNSGELLMLKDSLGNTINAIKYNDKAPWPDLTGNDFRSIELVDITTDNAVAENWVVSGLDDGTPGFRYGTRIKEVTAQNQIEMYPNPAKNSLYFTTTGSTDIEIRIFNLSGAEIAHHLLHHQKSIDLQSISEGSYVVKIRSNKQTVSRHLTIIR